MNIHDCRVRSGDIQSMSFAKIEDNPLPPFNYLLAPFEDAEKTTPEGKLKKIKGYAGKAKGIAHVLWERGLWIKGMKLLLKEDDIGYPHRSAKTVLANCDDFKAEVGAMEELIQSYGHIVMFSRKGHPEIAGAGIEFDWGVSKKLFRRNNNHIASNCEHDVRASLELISLQIAKNTSRKARSYMRAYEQDGGGSQLLIEKFVKLHKSHRNILDQEGGYLERLRAKIEVDAADVKIEKLVIETEQREKEKAVAVKIEKYMIAKEK